MMMLFTLLFTVLTATPALASGVSQEEASFTLTRGHLTRGVTIVIDGYTHYSTLASGDSVPLGTQLILVCQVVGLPYGTPLNYTWICPNETCEVEGNYSRKVYNEHILAVNTTSTSDGETYTCQVTATGGQKANASFILNVTGGSVVHSLGRLIPHEFPITDLQQISGPDGNGTITCTVSSGTAEFNTTCGVLETGGLSQTRNGTTARLLVNPRHNYHSRQVYCSNLRANLYFYLFISDNNSLNVPNLTVIRSTNSSVEYCLNATDLGSNLLISGYEVTRFGVPMIGVYVNTCRGRRVTISPAVPGAQYRITAWALGNGSRSATPALVNVTTGETSPSKPRRVTITRLSQDGVELNWLPPTEPNGEVHYVIEHKRENSGNWTSVNTTRDSTHYNLTGLHNGTNYTIRVVAVNSAGRNESTPITIETASITPTPYSTATPTSSSTNTHTSSSTATPTSNITATPTSSSTATPTSSSTATPTSRSTAIPTSSSTATPTSSSTATPTSSSTATPTSSSTATPTSHSTVLLISSSTDTHTSSSTATPTSNITVTPTSSSTATPTSSSTATPTSHNTAIPTSSSTATPTSSITATPTSSSTATPTSSSTAILLSSSIATHICSSTATPTSSSTATPTSHNTATPTSNSTAPLTSISAATLVLISSISATPISSSIATPTSNIIDTPTSNITATPTSSSTVAPTSSSTATPTSSSSATPTPKITPPWNNTRGTNMADGAVTMAGVAGGVAAAFFLLLILLFTSIVIGLVLRRAQKGKRNHPGKREGVSERVGNAPRTRASEWYEEVELDERAGDPQYEKPNSLGQGCGGGKVSEVRFVGDYSEVIDDADVPSKDVDDQYCNDQRENDQKNNQPMGTPNAVYAVINKDKKEKGRTDDGAPKQGVHTEEQHYECSNTPGQDWLGNVAFPMQEPSTPQVVYAEVDKSKKKTKVKKDTSPSATATQGAELEGQHYECSDVLGQDWFGKTVSPNGSPYTEVEDHRAPDMEIAIGENVNPVPN